MVLGVWNFAIADRQGDERKTSLFPFRALLGEKLDPIFGRERPWRFPEYVYVARG